MPSEDFVLVPNFSIKKLNDEASLALSEVPSKFNEYLRNPNQLLHAIISVGIILYDDKIFFLDDKTLDDKTAEESQLILDSIRRDLTTDATLRRYTVPSKRLLGGILQEIGVNSEILHQMDSFKKLTFEAILFEERSRVTSCIRERCHSISEEIQDLPEENSDPQDEARITRQELESNLQLCKELYRDYDSKIFTSVAEQINNQLSREVLGGAETSPDPLRVEASPQTEADSGALLNSAPTPPLFEQEEATAAETPSLTNSSFLMAMLAHPATKIVGVVILLAGLAGLGLFTFGLLPAALAVAAAAATAVGSLGAGVLVPAAVLGAGGAAAVYATSTRWAFVRSTEDLNEGRITPATLSVEESRPASTYLADYNQLTAALVSNVSAEFDEIMASQDKIVEALKDFGQKRVPEGTSQEIIDEMKKGFTRDTSTGRQVGAMLDKYKVPRSSDPFNDHMFEAVMHYMTGTMARQTQSISSAFIGSSPSEEKLEDFQQATRAAEESMKQAVAAKIIATSSTDANDQSPLRSTSPVGVEVPLEPESPRP